MNRVTPGNHPYRGNVTSIKQWLDSTGTDLTSTSTYFDTGMVQQTSDPLSHASTYQYSSTYHGAYRTQTCRPQTGTYTHCVSGTYDFNTGLLSSFTDENNQISDYTYDTMQRLTNAKAPAVTVQGSSLRPETQFTYYTWPANTPQVRRQQRIDSTRWTDLWVMFDGLGREQRRISFNDESTNQFDQTDTCYDSRGNVVFKPYPYQSTGFNATKRCPGASTLGDTFTYDALGRTTLVTHSDGTYIQTDYTGWATILVFAQEPNLGSAQFASDVRAITTINLIDGTT
jgi:YD repeat-containing protein